MVGDAKPGRVLLVQSFDGTIDVFRDGAVKIRQVEVWPWEDRDTKVRDSVYSARELDLPANLWNTIVPMVRREMSVSELARILGYKDHLDEVAMVRQMIATIEASKVGLRALEVGKGAMGARP